jgi:acetyl esterase
MEEAGEDTAVSSRPNALVLFNPALVLAPVEGLEGKALDPSLNERFGTDGKNVSPAHHVKAGAPPTIVFHGQADTTVPYATAEFFAKAMKQAGNRCELVGYPDQAHGFFNWGRAGNQNFAGTLIQTHTFLKSLGWLPGEPRVKEFFADQIGK